MSVETATRQYQSSERDAQHDRAIRMIQVVQKFASTLCQREVRTRLVETGVAPAWSTSNTITFSENDLADLRTAEGVLSSKGLSLHEVSHILFTPRSGTDIVRWVMVHKLGHAFNALEDQRIETLMVGRFGDSVVPWLTAVVAQHLVSKPEQLQTAFPLIRGRKYLPIELRQACRDLYVDQSNVTELSSIIDEYRTLLFPQDTERAVPLIARYAELVKGVEPESGCTKRSADQYDSNGESRPASKRQQESARAKAEARDEEDEQESDPFDFGDPSNDWDNEDESDDAARDSDADEQSDEDGAESEDAGDASGDDGFGTQPSAEGTQASDSGQKVPGKGTKAGNQPATESVTDLLNGILEQTAQRLADELNTDIAKYNGDTELATNKSATPRPADSVAGTVDEVTVRASKSFGTELERLKAQFDPGWEREVSSGRINPSRYMRGCDLDEAFDRWSIGRDDAVDIEAVILLDSSGSMSGTREQYASGSMWGLKRALDRVGANCTVVTFDYNAQLLYKGDEPASSTVKRVEPRGGTNPEVALQYATRVLAESDRAIKVLFTITDGEWSNAEACDELVKNLRRAGVLTALAYITEYTTELESINAHQSEVVSHIASTADLFVLGRQLVKVATQRNLTK